jgi:glutamate-1-semialdehyde aminotransferase
MPEAAKQIVTAYLRCVGESRVTGSTTTEISFCNALETLLKAIGGGLNAAVWTGRQKATRKVSGR